LTRLRTAFERLRPRLVTFRTPEGTELFDLPDAPRPAPDTPAPPRFLPEYDNLLLSHADRTRVVPAAHRGLTRKGNVAYSVLLVDGFVAGLWRLGDDALVIEPFGTFTRTRWAEVTAEAERMLATMHPERTYGIRSGTVRS
ncbi:winged helix DNA-binding domain-containing protein, partial [Streptomyces sp. ISL-12]|uniref:DNA glycosylase AlkZ-like family protein n=1 Tax=Streptomyces sp. ISL-12 TaxID=2819177 RepID=UPI001BE897F0